MGLILDSSVLITAEREGQNARQMLVAISVLPACPILLAHLAKSG